MLPTACLGREMRSLSSGDRPCGRNCPKKATYPALVLRDEARRPSRRSSHLGFAWRTHSDACATGTADRSPPVPVVGIEGPRVQKAFTAEECCAHSFCTGASVHDTDVAMMEERRTSTTSRSLCSLNSLGTVSQASLRAAKHARMHYSHADHTACTA